MAVDVGGEITYGGRDASIEGGAEGEVAAWVCVVRFYENIYIYIYISIFIWIFYS